MARIPSATLKDHSGPREDPSSGIKSKETVKAKIQLRVDHNTHGVFAQYYSWHVCPSAH